jgi:hypothetical protein
MQSAALSNFTMQVSTASQDEPQSSRCASRSAERSLVLPEQSRSLMLFLHELLAPKRTLCCGIDDRLKEYRPGAAMYSGRC